MKRLALAATIGLFLTSGAQAALVDRGGGLLYDTVLHVTWLQDANYAKTSGYSNTGLMTWEQATTWAANLVFHDTANGLDYSGWRLATNSPVNGVWDNNFSYNGSTDLGYNITSPNSELSYMYYVNLGLTGAWGPNSNLQPNFGIFGNGNWGGQNDVGPIRNLQSLAYWSGAGYSPYPATLKWYFDTRLGRTDITYEGVPYYAWAVRPGDVAAVPEPETYAMMLAGLGLLGLSARRRKANQH